MINKDYILRLAERFGRHLAIILRLRQFDKHEEALIYIDDLLLSTVGLTSRFINSLSDEMLIKSLSPLGILNQEQCLWTATLLKAEGEIYEEMNNANESYYRYCKSLYLLLEVLLHGSIDRDSEFYLTVRELLNKLEDYELPNTIKSKLFTYYEHIGNYAKAEDTLFELLESEHAPPEWLERGHAFYTRLLTKSSSDLIAGNMSREEVIEGQAQLKQMED